MICILNIVMRALPGTIKKYKSKERLVKVMDMFEKVDMLRERANVSYEEAKNALEKSNGDVLEAMILLEREGKTSKSGSDNFNTDSAAQAKCCKGDEKSFGEKLKALIHKSTVNYLVIDRKDERIFRVPVLAMALLLIFMFPATVCALVVSLFLDCRYSFEGQDEMKTANAVCDKAGDIADQLKDEVVAEYNAL